MKTKRFISFASSLVVALSSIFVLAPAVVHAATITWDGGGGDENMQTAENWVGDVAPTAGDSLVFPAGAAQTSVINDFAEGTSFSSITFSGDQDGGGTYDISGNGITLGAGLSCTDTQYARLVIDITLAASQSFQTGSDCGIYVGSSSTPKSLSLGNNNLSFTAPNYIFVYSSISGTGNITVSSTNSYVVFDTNNSYTGTTLVETGNYLYINDDAGLGASSGATTVQDGATLGLFKNSADMNIAEPITVAGSGVLSVGNFAGRAGSFAYGDSTVQNKTLTLSGALTLTGDVGLSLFGTNNTIRITGSMTGDYDVHLLKGISKSNKLVIDSSSNGSKTPNGTYYSEKSIVTITDSQPSMSVSVNDNREYVVNGVRGATTVYSGGVLKGTGTVGVLNVQSGGKVAPGLSPGCLASGNVSYTSGSTHEAELGGTTVCTDYDQLQVTGTVSLGNATLVTSLYNSYAPTAGATYTIISNDGTDAITGTFNNLAEGATITIDGTVLRISYVGGDGNDVVLTVVTAPAAPNTGFALLTSNPAVTLGTTTLAAGALMALSRRGGRKYTARRR